MPSSNAVHTARYTAWNFVPKNLYEQLTTVANTYFLFVMVLQCIKPISVTGGVPSIALPLSFVLIVNAVKDAIEDSRRWQSDKLENNQQAALIQLSSSNVGGAPFTLQGGKQVALRFREKSASEISESVMQRRTDMKLLQHEAMQEAPTHDPRGWVMLQALGSPGNLAAVAPRGSTSQIGDGPSHDDFLSVSDGRISSTLDGPSIISAPPIFDDSRVDVTALDASPMKDKLFAVNWQDVQVGDLVVVFKNDLAPADGLVLASSDKRETLFIETSSLDGETSLKIKKPFLFTNRLINAVDGNPTGLGLEETFMRCATLSMSVEVGSPCPELNSFNATVHVGRGTWSRDTWCRLAGTSEQLYSAPATKENLLLRGCRVCHTAWAIMLVVYTGSDTKIRLNSTKPAKKVSKLERKTHKLVLVMFFTMVSLCIISSAFTIWMKNSTRFMAFRYSGFNLPVSFHKPSDVNVAQPLAPWSTRRVMRVILAYFISFFTWMLLLTNFVPISLVVSMGLVRSFQAWHMSRDVHMISPEKGPCVVRTSDLNEDLGQVKFVMTDKTGTLTANNMQFRKCAIGTHIFGSGVTEMRRRLLLKTNALQPTPSGPLSQTFSFRQPAESYGEPLGGSLTNGSHISRGLITSMRSSLRLEPLAQTRRPSVPHCNCHSQELDNILLQGVTDTACSRGEVLLFFLNLTINHSALVDEEDPDTYIASSPDEEALLYGAKKFHVEFAGRDGDGLLVDYLGCRHKIRIDYFYPFDSVRKRSCVVVSFDFGALSQANAPPREDHYLMVKGADTSVFPLCSEVSESTHKILGEFAEDCLRTLVLASRRLSNDEFEGWQKQLNAALLTRDEEQVMSTATILERDLDYQGITGIEDMLADEVPETIESLLKAGICVWMITGDKFETAFNIGLGTNLVPMNQRHIVLTEERLKHTDNLEEVFGLLQQILEHDKAMRASGAERVGHRKSKMLADVLRSKRRRSTLKRQSSEKEEEPVYSRQQPDSESTARRRRVPGDPVSLLEEDPDEEDNSSSSRISWADGWGSDAGDHVPANEILADNVLTRVSHEELDRRLHGEASTEGLHAERRIPMLNVPDPIMEEVEEELEEPGGSRMTTIIWDGVVLRQCLADAALRPYVYRLSSLCYSAIFCRASPQDKGDVVRLCREMAPKSVCLAVGDGANDCNMLTAANIGVGIKGREGLQAFNSSDYGLTEFKHLRTLLLVHGRWNYRRLSKMVLHTFYKNFVFCMPTYFFAAYSLFSGQRTFSESIYMLYNVALTQLPVLCYGIWDQDVSRELSLAFPQLYKIGTDDMLMRTRVIVYWLLTGFWHALCVFFIPVFGLCGMNVVDVVKYLPTDYMTVSIVMFFQIMLVVNAKLLLETMCPNFLTVVSIAISFLFLLVHYYVISVWPTYSPQTVGLLGHVVTDMPFVWVLTIICFFVSISVDVVIAVFERSFKPELHHLMQFLMRFEQEEKRAKKLLILEAVKQGGPQLLQALGFERKRNKKSLSDEDIDRALRLHRKEKAARGGTTVVVLEVLQIKSLMEQIKGGFAFSPDVRSQPLDLPTVATDLPTPSPKRSGE